MLPELLDIIVLLCDVDTIKNFIVSKHFYQYIGTKQFWIKKAKCEDIYMATKIDRIDCQDIKHQHGYIDKSHYNITDWINYYKLCSQSKIHAINTLLVNQIQFTINPYSYIKISFKNKGILPYNVERDICKYMQIKQITNWTDTHIQITPKKIIYTAVCNIRKIISDDTTDANNNLKLLSYYYSDKNAIITNENNQPFKESYTWKIADCLGHILK